MQQKKEINNFSDIAEFLDKLDENDKAKVYEELNKFIVQYLQEHPIETISPGEGESFKEQDNSFETFLRRAVYAFVQGEKTKTELNILLKEDVFDKNTDLSYEFGSMKLQKCPSFLTVATTSKIFVYLVAAVKNNKLDITNKLFSMVYNLCQHTSVPQPGSSTNIENIKNAEQKQVLPLDLVIGMVSACSDYGIAKHMINKIYPFIDMNPANFIDKNKKFLDREIYLFLRKMPIDCVGKFLADKNFVKALGGIDKLKKLLDINRLEQKQNKDAQKLAQKLHDNIKKIDFSEAKIENNKEGTGIKIIYDEDYKQKVKRLFAIHQLPKSLASAFIFLFGIGLLFAAGFAWSVPFLLGIGFIIPSIAAFVNSILCMKPTTTRTWLAKIFKNCAWIVDGALLITLGAVFCAGPLAAVFITFGSLGALMGCFNAFVGTLNSMWDTQREMIDGNDVKEIDDIKPEILSHKIFNLVVFAVACVTGILLALNPAILPIALPFLPAIGIGIAALSGLGVIKSALRLFYDNSSWQVRFYHAAKYIKAGMFVLGGLGLIALPFLPIAATLASVIGMPTLVVNIFSFLVGLSSAVKGCMSVTRMSSNIEFNLADRAMKHACSRAIPLIDEWKNKLYGNRPSKPQLKPGDISNRTLQNIFYE